MNSIIPEVIVASNAQADSALAKRLLDGRIISKL